MRTLLCLYYYEEDYDSQVVSDRSRDVQWQAKGLYGASRHKCADFTAKSRSEAPNLASPDMLISKKVTSENGAIRFAQKIRKDDTRFTLFVLGYRSQNEVQLFEIAPWIWGYNPILQRGDPHVPCGPVSVSAKALEMTMTTMLCRDMLAPPLVSNSIVVLETSDLLNFIPCHR